MNNLRSHAVTARKSEHQIADIFKERWSPRGMTGEELPAETLSTLFEAAKWAPSAYNEQPWRVLYARRNSASWNTFFNLLVEFNQGWCKNASALLVFISKNISGHNGSPLPTHSFDTGAAWENLALQGAMLNLVVHGMSGFDYEKARIDLKIPPEFTIEAMAAVGVYAETGALPPALQEKEQPSSRRPVEKSVVEGIFTEALK